MNTVYTLNLDPDFKVGEGRSQELNFNLTYFPGGEPHFYFKDAPCFDPETATLSISQRFNSVADLMTVIIATDAARRMGFKRIALFLPYFPAARQDRVCNPGEALTVKVFADLINGCKFERVLIYSPHSEVTPALLDNCEILDKDTDVLRCIINRNTYAKDKIVNIVCPDAGAGKRVGKLARSMAEAFPDLAVNLIRCEKVRDVKTGELKEFFVQSNDLGKGLTIICDDIVAYGGTFKGLGNVLKEKNCGRLVLFTSHADCQEGLDSMADYFDMVYTSNSKKNWEVTGANSGNLHCFRINS